jgi:hypothetical protein
MKLVCDNIQKDLFLHHSQYYYFVNYSFLWVLLAVCELAAVVVTVGIDHWYHHLSYRGTTILSAI